MDGLFSDAAADKKIVFRWMSHFFSRCQRTNDFFLISTFFFLNKKKNPSTHSASNSFLTVCFLSILMTLKKEKRERRNGPRLPFSVEDFHHLRRPPVSITRILFFVFFLNLIGFQSQFDCVDGRVGLVPKLGLHHFWEGNWPRPKKKKKKEINKK